MDHIEQALFDAAQEGVRNAFTEKGNIDDSRLGSAVLTSAGNVYGSGHYTSLTGSLTLHAEQAALAHAAAHGEYAIKKILVTWNAVAGAKYGEPIYPCHMCKQLLWEHLVRTGQEMEILIANPNGQIMERLMLRDIMLHTWPKMPSA